MSRARVAVYALALAATACSANHRPEVPAPVPPDAAAPTAPEVPDAAVALSARASDPLWMRAAGDDPLDRSRLALEVGATELLAGVEEGGTVARTALLALPYADDADIALGRLAEMALAASNEELRPLLAAIHAVAGEPRRPRELLDPEGVRRAGEAMVTIAKRAGVARGDRALAVSAARALALKGYVDASAIPGDLDPSPPR